MKDIAAAVDELGLIKLLFDTAPFFLEFVNRTKALVKQLEESEFGEVFGMYLHYEMNLTFDKIHRLNQAACMKFDRELNRYKSKVLLYNPHLKDDPHHRTIVKVPRIAPPFHKMVTTKKKIEEKLNVSSNENGRLAYTCFNDVVQQLVMQDCGTQGMPPLTHFEGGHNKIHLVISFDGTGFGSQQINTIALNNPRTSQSAQMLFIFGIGNCADDRSGTTRLLGPNLAIINNLMAKPEQLVEVCGKMVSFTIFVVLDVAALRHTEHISNSGWCCCSRDVALRQTPIKPTNVAEMYELLKQCHEPTCDERTMSASCGRTCPSRVRPFRDHVRHPAAPLGTTPQLSPPSTPPCWLRRQGLLATRRSGARLPSPSGAWSTRTSTATSSPACTALPCSGTTSGKSSSMPSTWLSSICPRLPGSTASSRMHRMTHERRSARSCLYGSTLLTAAAKTTTECERRSGLLGRSGHPFVLGSRAVLVALAR